MFVIISCNSEELISELGDSAITAKLKVSEILNTAKKDFAADAKLTSIYGLNISSTGEVDLLKPTENAFIYIVQSDSTQTNELYIPVYKNIPVRSPINFSDMLILVKDDAAKAILGEVFNSLSTLHIESSVNYDDSPAVISKMLARNDVAAFRANNINSKIDMYLIPSKSLDTTSITNAADWIVNFYGDTSSLVLWLHPGMVNGNVDVISN
jgi:hypothetical protein